MIGKSITHFIDSLYDNPEIEVQFHNTRMLISGYIDSDNKYTLRVDTIETQSRELFSITSDSRQECVSAFENAKIFNGLSIYESEKEIIVLYG